MTSVLLKSRCDRQRHGIAGIDSSERVKFQDPNQHKGDKGAEIFGSVPIGFIPQSTQSKDSSMLLSGPKKQSAFEQEAAVHDKSNVVMRSSLCEINAQQNMDWNKENEETKGGEGGGEGEGEGEEPEGDQEEEEDEEEGDSVEDDDDEDWRPEDLIGCSALPGQPAKEAKNHVAASANNTKKVKPSHWFPPKENIYTFSVFL